MITLRAKRNGFTLLELMAVVTCLAILVGVTTLGMQSVTDDARIHTSAVKLASGYRLAVTEASQTGRPRLMEIESKGFRIRKPMHRDDAWQWSLPPRIELSDGVRVLGAAWVDDPNDLTSAEGPWRLTIAPDVQTHNLWLVLALRDIKRVVAIDGRLGSVTVASVDD